MPAYRGERDQQDDEQRQLQRQLGDPVSQTQPVGQPEPEAAAAPQPDPNGVEARQALGGYAGKGQMLGFNQGGYNGDLKAGNSVKNTFGRIASRYDAKPSSMKLIAQDPDFQRYFAGATFDDKDRLHLPAGMLSDFESGVGGMGGADGIDVLGSADVGSDSAAGWTWQDGAHDGGGGGGAMGGGMGGQMDPMALLQQGNPDDLGNSDALAAILAELQRASGGGGQGEQALLQQLLGGQ